MLSQFDALAPESLRLAMARPEFKKPHAVTMSPTADRTIAHLLVRVQEALWVQDPSGIVA